MKQGSLIGASRSLFRQIPERALPSSNGQIHFSVLFFLSIYIIIFLCFCTAFKAVYIGQVKANLNPPSFNGVFYTILFSGKNSQNPRTTRCFPSMIWLSPLTVCHHIKLPQEVQPSKDFKLYSILASYPSPPFSLQMAYQLLHPLTRVLTTLGIYPSLPSLLIIRRVQRYEIIVFS